MKNKVLMGLIATTTIGTAIATPAIINSQNTTNVVNKVLMVNNKSNSSTNEAVVINGNSKMSLYALSNGSGIVSNLSVGEMLTILGQSQNGYCKVKVQETGAIGYISVANMQNILNGTNDTFTQLSGNGQVINVSSNVRLRSNPAIGNNIIGHLTNGTSLNILGKQGQWYKVSVNGQRGFIYEEYVSTNIANNSVSINSNNSNTSTTSSSSSNSTSSSNSSNHVKNIVVRTKKSSTNSNHINIHKQNKEIKNKSTIDRNELAAKMRQWILVGQYNYSGFSDLNGTVWGKQWIDNVSNKELVTAFVKANGENSLNKNITPAELNKAAMQLTPMILKQPMPFSVKQATKYIKQMMSQSYPNQIVTKIVSDNGGYKVYTKQLGNTPFWYVNGYTGAATGV